MFCPMVTRIELAYMLKYYPDKYEWFMQKVRETEAWYKKEGKTYFYFSDTEDADAIDKRIRTKWMAILETRETTEQMNLFDYLEEKGD